MPLPTVLITYSDGSTRTIAPSDISSIVNAWALSPADGIVRIDLNPGQPNLRGVDFIFSGGDRFWVYPEGPTTLVLGWRRPALEEPFLDPPANTIPNPNHVLEHLQEAVYDRRPNVGFVVREPASIPLAATVKSWPHG